MQEWQKRAERYLPLSKKISDNIYKDPKDQAELLYALPGIPKIWHVGQPKDLAHFHDLLREALRCELRFNDLAPGMTWQCEECLNQKITSFDEAKELHAMLTSPGFSGAYPDLCAFIEMLRRLQKSESLRLLIEDTARSG